MESNSWEGHPEVDSKELRASLSLKKEIPEADDIPQTTFQAQAVRKKQRKRKIRKYISKRHSAHLTLTTVSVREVNGTRFHARYPLLQDKVVYDVHNPLSAREAENVFFRGDSESLN